MSPQYSLFWNDEEQNSKWNEQWNCEYHFVNETNSLEFIIGGDQEQGVIHYIEWLGFFEGGHPNNLYRLDPFVVVGCITGKIHDSTIRIYSEMVQAKIDVARSEVEEVKKESHENHSQELADWLCLQQEKMNQMEGKKKQQVSTLLSLLDPN